MVPLPLVQFSTCATVHGTPGEGGEPNSFGPLSSDEWRQLYKYQRLEERAVPSTRMPRGRG